MLEDITMLVFKPVDQLDTQNSHNYEGRGCKGTDQN